MIKNRQHHQELPLVPWQGQEGDAFLIFRLADKQNSKPADGHNPEIPHRIGFHAIFLVTNGSFDHWMDFETHRLKGNQLVYIAPNQIHHFIKSNKRKDAWILIFRPELLPHDLLSTITNHQLSWSVVSYLWPSLSTLKIDQTQLLEAQLELVHKLQSGSHSAESTAVKHHVCGVIASAFELATKNCRQLLKSKTNERFFDFIQLVEEGYRIRRDVKWYAAKLKCSERTLNRACLQMTGKSAKALLTERVAVEAKRILTYSADPISSIGESLGFGETTNFVRFFKNEVGMTPQAFRAII